MDRSSSVVSYHSSAVESEESSDSTTMSDWRQAIRTPFAYRVSNSTIRVQTHFVYTVAVAGLCVLLLLYLLMPNSRSGYRLTNAQNLDDYHDHMHSSSQLYQYNHTYPLSPPVRTGDGLTRYRIAVIADLDTNSKEDSKDSWFSILKTGHLTYDAVNVRVHIDWDEKETKLRSSLAYGGRGMELSELIVFNGRLYTVDDRTGVVYEIVDGNRVVPWLILSDGDGKQSKGFKGEWMTVKGTELYVGGLGKLWTSGKGQVLNDNPQWVKVVSPLGETRHVNWRNNYDRMMESLGIRHPGYVIHEAGVWSRQHSEWFFLPRRVSSDKYDEDLDEQRGSNRVLRCSEAFSDVRVTSVGGDSPSTHGFSSFKFVPFTRDEVLVALKSEEDRGRIATYITAFDLHGRTLYPETKIGDHKFEGIEFV